MQSIYFNIQLKASFKLIDFLNLVEKIYDEFKFSKLELDYTPYFENVVPDVKEFDSFKSFSKFWNPDTLRLGLLILKQPIIAEVKSIVFSRGLFDSGGFKDGNGRLTISGSVNSKSLISQILLQVEHIVLYAYLHSEMDYILSKSTSPDTWKKYLGYIPNYIDFIENNNKYRAGNYLIDLESNPSHQLLMVVESDELWFGAFAEMYFSETYYNYIPKKKWNNINSCVENEILASGLRKVVLYKKFENFESTNNRKSQREFRRELGIDDLNLHTIL